MELQITVLMLFLISLNRVVSASDNQLDKLEGKVTKIDQVFQETGEILTNYLQDTPQRLEDGSKHYVQGGIEMEFTASPRIILPQITESLVINCSVDLQKLESVKITDDVISEITAISVMRDDEDIASYRRTKPALSFEDDPTVVLEGKFTQKSGYLTITYTNPTSNKAGVYLCLVGGFDQRNYPLIRGRTRDLIDVDYIKMMSDMNLLQNKTNLNSRTLSEQQQDIEDINLKSQKQNREVVSLNKTIQHQKHQIEKSQETDVKVEDLRNVESNTHSMIEELKKTFNKELEEVKKDLKTSNAKIKDLTKDLKKSEDTNKERQQEMKAKIQELEEDNNILNQSMSSINRENLALKQSLDSLRKVARIEPDVFFSVVHDGGVYIDAGKTFVFDQIITNQGNRYNRTTGMFTCEMSGFYYFEVHLLGYGSNNLRFYLRHNSKNVLHIIANGDGNDNSQASKSVYLLLEKGDTVNVLAVNKSYISGSWTPPASVFNGRLISVK